MSKKIPYYISTIYRWLRRCRYSRGFGIQSPSAYSFVRYVINEHYPYYAYQELDEKYRDEGKLFCKLGRLFFRIANFWQPEYVLLDNEATASYIHAGCQKAQIGLVDDFLLKRESGTCRSMFVLDVEYLLNDVSLKEFLFNIAIDQTLLVLRHIYSNGDNKRVWKKILEDDRTGISYDLHSCGIVFFDKTKHKQHFKVNF